MDCLGACPDCGKERWAGTRHICEKAPINLSLYSLRLANIERDKEWNPNKKLTPLFRATELGGETGEALNVVKKLERERLGIKGSRATINQLAGELSDILICVDLLAMEYDIDLTQALRNTFNATSEKQNLSVKI